MIDRFNFLMLDLYAKLQQPRLLLQREEGQGTVEYVLIFAGAVAMAAGLVLALSTKMTTKITGISF